MTAAAVEVAVADTAVAVPGQCDKQTALSLTREIKGSLEQSWRLIKEAFERRAWAALGYASWEAYCTKEFGSHLTRLSKELRREAVAELTSGDQPMSNRAAAVAIGVSESTVRADRAAGARNRAPCPKPDLVGAEANAQSNVSTEAEAATTKVVEAEAVEDVEFEDIEAEADEAEDVEVEVEVGDVEAEAPVTADDSEDHGVEVQPSKSVRRVRGADGKSYTTEPESKSRRRPLTDASRGAAHDLDKVAARLVRLTQDDRFRANAPNLGAARWEIERAVDDLQKVLHALAKAGNG
ncbi:hypothetical protein [Geodermatophilus sp. URMC 60]